MWSSRHWVLCGSLVLTACGDSATDTSSTGSSTSSSSGGASAGGATSASSTGGAVGVGGAKPCTADEHTGDDGTCDTEITWTAGPPIAIPRDHHMTFIVDPGADKSRFLYVAGGFAGSTILDSVVRAPLADDGSLGDWEDGGTLLTGAAGCGMVVTHNEVILAGGYQSNNSWTAPINSDGSLGTWAAGPKLDGIRFHTAAFSKGDYVYIVGGLQTFKTSDEIQRATIAADGSLGAWSVVAHLPYSLSHQVVLLDDSTLYVIGGQTGNTNDNSGKPHKEVLTATVADDGSIGAFAMTSELPSAYETSAGMLHDGFIYVVGGVVDKNGTEASGVPSADVVRAKILGPGKLGEWAVDKDSKLPKTRSHVHQVPVRGSNAYSVSGLRSTTDVPDVEIGTFH